MRRFYQYPTPYGYADADFPPTVYDLDELPPPPKMPRKQIQSLLSEARSLLAAENLDAALSKVAAAQEIAETNDFGKEKKACAALKTEIETAQRERQARIASNLATARSRFNAEKYEAALTALTKVFADDSENAEAKSLQAEIEKARRTFSDAFGMEFCRIPKETFMMGSPVSEEGRFNDEGPQHTVKISNDFYLGKYEVTVGDFRKFVSVTNRDMSGGAWGYNTAGKFGMHTELNWKSPGFSQTDSHPVACVSWDDAEAYVNWLNSQGAVTIGGVEYRYSFPSEAQWEYACRTGSETRFFWGDKEEDGEGYLNGADESGFLRVCRGGAGTATPSTAGRPSGTAATRRSGTAAWACVLP